jgi:hypothetical protein
LRRVLMMRWIKALLCVALISLMMAPMARSRLGAATNPPPEGGVLPQFDLPVPEDAQARTYLGLPGPGKFTVLQIKARLVIIEIFSMY